MVALNVLDQAGAHLSVTEIHCRMAVTAPGVNLSTVYRTLDRLETLRLVHRLDVHGEARYGSAEHDHHHAVCTRCGRILELDGPVVAGLLSGLESLTTLRPDPAAGLTVRGVCADCRAAG
ncbi:MAG: transcriptional repressor [Pseudonocardiales bacterium]|nr:MAG: transcriptional repressor [Pseudonocardiales bacterium]